MSVSASSRRRTSISSTSWRARITTGERWSTRVTRSTRISPWTYTFRVIASNNSGVWNEQGDVLEFSVAPAYYQTNWFRALCAAALMALLWAAHRSVSGSCIIGSKLTLDARVGESTRELRGSFTTLCFRAHTGCCCGSRRFPSCCRSARWRPKQGWTGRSSRRRQFITEARDEVQGLRDSTTQTNDLALAISSLGEGLATDSASHGPATFRCRRRGRSARSASHHFVMRSTRLPPKRSGMHFGTPKARQDRSGNPLRSMSNSAACAGRRERHRSRRYSPSQGE